MDFLYTYKPAHTEMTTKGDRDGEDEEVGKSATPVTPHGFQLIRNLLPDSIIRPESHMCGYIKSYYFLNAI